MNTNFPDKISTDGKELWDWAARLGDHIHRQHRISELVASIRDLEPRCGTCRHWMKRGDCPKEDGVSKGPSMNSPSCDKHTETGWVTVLREERRAELAALKGEK